MFSLIYCSLILVSINLSLVLSDEIRSLPGWTKALKFKQYSGYLNASEGRHHFYWFVESQGNPSKDPLILWLNGGPGCSSLFGMLGENGPFKVKNNGKTLTENINSWNTIANVLYMESPAGVGFSYDENKVYNNSDKQTAEDNFLALQSFFKKYPNFKGNSFYISGESYAGVYIPMLALQILRRDSTIKLKGLAIGNGLLDERGDSRIKFALNHGLVSTNLINDLKTDCCKCNNNNYYECVWDKPSNSKCNASDILEHYMWYEVKLNPYNIYSDCKKSFGFHQLSNYFGININRDILYESVNSVDEKCGNGYSQYLKLEEVRRAIHVNEKSGEWHECNNITYVEDRGHSQESKSMKEAITEIISKHKIHNIIIYNGDLDIVCDFIGNQEFVDELGLKLTQKYKRWSANGFTAGFVKRYEGLSFIIVRGAGHMVPQDKPEAALKIVKELIGVSKVDE